MKTFSEYLKPSWEFGGDTGSDELTLQDRQDMQAINILNKYVDGKITLAEFSEKIEATGVHYTLCDITGLVELASNIGEVS
jgi:hypothetical protein